MSGPGPVRRTVHFSGRVQGVGFRYTTAQVGRGYPITGYVRNLADGRVELVAEGAESDVEAFVQAVSREMKGYIRDAQAAAGPATGEFDAFEIRH